MSTTSTTTTTTAPAGTYLLTGAEIVARAAIDAGCTFFAGYPITPATGILREMVARLRPPRGRAVQVEDEIAAAGMCVGAALAGARAMTATSGPGLSLMSESIGLAVMLECPLVVVDVQRMGPATGGATAHAEGDLGFLRYPAPGGYPVPALAPTTPGDTYLVVQRAFALAERLRTPVFVATSKELVMSTETVGREELVPEPIAPRAAASDDPHRPYAIARPGDVPPFAPVGGDRLVRYTTSIHDERGIITGNRAAIDRKLRHLIAKVEENVRPWVEIGGDAGAPAAIVAYGVMARVAREVARRVRVRTVVPYSIWPAPDAALRAALEGARRIVVPELNPGIYVHEIERIAAGRDVSVVSLTRLDGSPLSAADVIQRGGIA